MVKIKNIFGDVYSGQAGEAGVFAKWKGIQYRRKYVVPANPRTPMQMRVRSSFAAIVRTWHEFLSLQRLAYGYMATGLAMSGFNLLISRWQRMTAAARLMYVRPFMGMKQIGSTALTAIAEVATVAGTATYTTAERPLGLGQTSYVTNTSGVTPRAIIDVARGRVTVPTAIVGELRISYTSLGRSVVNELLATGPAAGATLYTRFFPIDFGTISVSIAGAVVDGLEVDITGGRFRFTRVAPTDASGRIRSNRYTPLENARFETQRVDTNFITWRDFTTKDGILLNAQTQEDGARDIHISLAGFHPIVRANVSAEDTARDEYIRMMPV